MVPNYASSGLVRPDGSPLVGDPEDALRTFDDIGLSESPRSPHANVSNASYLMGDPFGDTDDELGDTDDPYGDVDDPYGDINDDMTGAYLVASGDADDEEIGDTKVSRFIKKNKNYLIAGGAAAGVTGLGLLARKAILARRRKKAAITRAMNASRTRETLRTQKLSRSYLGKLNPNKQMPFFSLTGATMNSAPIDTMSNFVARTWRYNLERQESDTPFFQETAPGAFGGGSTWTCTATGPATPRYYTALILQLGINALNGAPSTVFSVTATLPLINGGTLTVLATPWIFTIKKGFDVRFIFFPWQLVANKPLFALGQYGAGNNITVTVNGLPAASAVNLIVPGSLHPWIIGIRNAFIR